MGAPKISITFEERLKYALVPGPLYIRYRVRKERRRGEAELALLPFLVDPGRNAVDAGANKGVYTHVISRLARRTHAFEPNPKIFRILKRNVGGSVTTWPVALADTSGHGILRLPLGSKGHSNQGGSLNEATVQGGFTPIEIETIRLDDLGLPDIGFMKIDVEGFEAAVLRGAQATIARDRPTLLIEMEEKHTKRPIEEDLSKVLALGYDGFFLDGPRGMRPLSAFDPVAHHRRPQDRYVFNFIFLPSGGRADR
jgi:FkbM family methyltransferase